MRELTRTTIVLISISETVTSSSSGIRPVSLKTAGDGRINGLVGEPRTSNISFGGNRRGGLEFKVINEDERMILLDEHSPLAAIPNVEARPSRPKCLTRRLAVLLAPRFFQVFFASSSSSPGSLILQSAIPVLDLDLSHRVVKLHVFSNSTSVTVALRLPGPGRLPLLPLRPHQEHLQYDPPEKQIR